jgi:hypothetical protein
MKKDDKRLIIYFGVIFLAVVLNYPLPHDSYSILQYAFHPLQTENSIFYLAKIIYLILLVIGISGVLTAERFRRGIKLVKLLYILCILIPLMGLVIDFARVTYHTAARDGIHSVDIKSSDLSLSQTNGSATININLELKNYSFYDNKFGIRIYLPKTLSEYYGKESYEFDTKYQTHNYSNKLDVTQLILVGTPNTEARNSFPPDKWQYEDVKFELFDDKRTVAVIRHGL